MAVHVQCLPQRERKQRKRLDGTLTCKTKRGIQSTSLPSGGLGAWPWCKTAASLKCGTSNHQPVTISGSWEPRLHDDRGV